MGANVLKEINEKTVTFFFNWASLTSHRELMNIEDICETGPTVYSPYRRRLESLTI